MSFDLEAKALAHNLKVTGSNPVPATKKLRVIKRLHAALRGGVCVCKTRGSTVEARGREVLRADAQPKTTHSALNGWTKPENAAQQHFHILARDRVSGDWLIIELKRAKATPDAVLQTTDYRLPAGADPARRFCSRAA